jgi:hypothetical protein
MKQKLFLAVLLIAGVFINGQAQDKSTGDQTITVIGRGTSTNSASGATYSDQKISVEGKGTIGSFYSQMINGVENAAGNRSSLNLSKSFKGESVQSETEFEVPQESKGINLSLNGSCKNGGLIIKIYLPNGEPYKTQKISPAADISWNTSLPFSDENSKKFKGNWKLKIEATNCEGRYNLNISTR